MQVLVHPEERLLVHITRVFGRPEQVERKTKHPLVIGLNQLLESVLVPCLRSTYERRLIHVGLRPCAERSYRLPLSAQVSPFPEYEFSDESHGKR
jgi:hypothetical protein